MVTVTKAVSADFERVYPLFERFGNPQISRDDWRKIFVSPWPTTEDFCGFLLQRDGEIKGYLGAIFSQRRLDNRVEKFCNMTSWIVTEDCRGQGILLLAELLKLKEYTLTNFTASPEVAAILARVGFKQFSIDQRVLFPIPFFRRKPAAVNYNFDTQVIRTKLNDDDRRILDDHKALDCQHLLLQSDAGYCYLVLRKTRRKYLPFARVHYLSNAEVLEACLPHLIGRICSNLRVLGLMVDERYIGGRMFRPSVRYLHQRKGFFKSNSIVDVNSIDTIYSEMVILHY